MPKWSAETTGEKNDFMTQFDVQSPGFVSGKVWVNASDNQDFRPHKWTTVAQVSVSPESGKAGSKPVVRYLTESGKNVAILVEARFRFGGREFSVTQPVKVFLKSESQ